MKTHSKKVIISWTNCSFISFWGPSVIPLRNGSTNLVAKEIYFPFFYHLTVRKGIAKFKKLSHKWHRSNLNMNKNTNQFWYVNANAIWVSCGKKIMQELSLMAQKSPEIVDS